MKRRLNKKMLRKRLIQLLLIIALIVIFILDMQRVSFGVARVEKAIQEQELALAKEKEVAHLEYELLHQN